MNGVFITFEGCEGVGKSTQLRLLQEYLLSTGQEAVFTREPGGTEIAEKIRDIILSTDTDISPLVEAYLFATARADHMDKVIIPALKAGKIVICDRFVDSSEAYQGSGRNLGLQTVEEINRLALQGVTPNCTIFIDMNPATSWRKQNGRVVENDRMELEADEFHQKVYLGFKELSTRARYASIVPQENKYATSSSIIAALRQRGLIK
ncbi:MAG: dTMP kinase [Bacillota bacterium]